MKIQLQKAATLVVAAVRILATAVILSPWSQASGGENSSVAEPAVRGNVDLLQRYPTKLTAGDTRPEHARPWEFTDGDIFRVARFRLEVGKELRVEIGPADLGIGHCADGAVWAVLIPRAAER